MRFDERLMTFCITKRCSGVNDLGPSGFPLETRTRSIFTNRQANDAGKIPSKACMTQMGFGIQIQGR